MWREEYFWLRGDATLAPPRFHNEAKLRKAALSSFKELLRDDLGDSRREGFDAPV